MAAFLKFVMFTFNFIFWVIGGTMLGIGIWLAVDDDAYQIIDIASSAGMDDSVWAAAVYITIAVGSFLFLVGFLGCWGSLGNGRQVALKMYSIIVILILVLEVVVIILIAVFYSKITDSLKIEMREDVQEKYGKTDEESLTKAWDNMQIKFKCCGSYNYTDYKNSEFQKNNQEKYYVPTSCCSSRNISKCNEDAAEWKLPKPSPFLYTKGCYEGLEDYLEDNADILIGVTCGFAALQVVGVLIACCLMKSNNRNSI